MTDFERDLYFFLDWRRDVLPDQILWLVAGGNRLEIRRATYDTEFDVHTFFPERLRENHRRELSWLGHWVRHHFRSLTKRQGAAERGRPRPVWINLFSCVIKIRLRISFSGLGLVHHLHVRSLGRNLQLDWSALRGSGAYDNVDHVVIHDDGRKNNVRAQLPLTLREETRIYDHPTFDALDSLIRDLLCQLFDDEQRIAQTSAIRPAIRVVHVFIT